MQNPFGPEKSTHSQFFQSASRLNGPNRPENDPGELAPRNDVAGETGVRSRGQDFRPRRACYSQPWTAAPYPPRQQPSVADLSMVPMNSNQSSAISTMQYQPHSSTYHYPPHPSSTVPYHYQYPNAFDQDPKPLPVRPNPEAPPQDFDQLQILDNQYAYNPGSFALPPIQTSMIPPGPIAYPMVANSGMHCPAIRPPQRRQHLHSPGKMPCECSHSAHLQPTYPMSSQRLMVSNQGTELLDERHGPSRNLISDPGKTPVRKRARETDSKMIQLTAPVKRHKSGVSDEPVEMTWPTSFETKTIGHDGLQSGRNLLAKFEGADDTPRTRYNLRVLGGRGVGYLPDVRGYPECDKPIPGGLTLEEICQRFPRHVWGTGIRMFIANGWDGEKVYRTLPTEFRISKAVQRPWNFMQQGFSREIDRMKREDTGTVGQQVETDEESGVLDEPGLTHRDNGMAQVGMRESVDLGYATTLPSCPQWFVPAHEQYKTNEYAEIDDVAGINGRAWTENEFEPEWHVEPSEHQTDELNDRVEQIDQSMLGEPRYRDLFTIVRLIYAIYEACGVRERHVRFQKALLLLMLMRASPENDVVPQVDLVSRLEGYYDQICRQNGFEVENMTRDDLFVLSHELVRRTMICLDVYNARKPRDQVEQKLHKGGSTEIEEEAGERDMIISSDFELFGDLGEPDPLDL